MENTSQKIKRFFSFPHNWVLISIFILVCFSYFLAKYFFYADKEFYASIMISIFAGLITGFVITLVSSVKRITNVKLEYKKNWLMDIKEKIRAYIKCRDELILAVISENEEESYLDCFDKVVYCAYDVISCVYSINNDILHANEAIQFNRNNYCMGNYSYDALLVNEDLVVIQKIIQNYMDSEDIPKKQVLLYFHEVHSKIIELNVSISREIREIEKKEKEMIKMIF